MTLEPELPLADPNAPNDIDPALNFMLASELLDCLPWNCNPASGDDSRSEPEPELPLFSDTTLPCRKTMLWLLSLPLPLPLLLLPRLVLPSGEVRYVEPSDARLAPEDRAEGGLT